tara:strand:+ start:3324 stop:4196 length:873 start_codon:yes stop_codon:yes gene_type:complete
VENISVRGGTLIDSTTTVVDKERKKVVETIATINKGNPSVKGGSLIIKRIEEAVDVIQGGLEAMEEPQLASPNPDRPFYESTIPMEQRTVDEQDTFNELSLNVDAVEVRPPDGKVDLEKELDIILESEGGFQNRKNDSGNYRPDGVLIGTNRGITVRALAAYRNVDPNTITEEDIRNVTDEQAREIFRQNYYFKPKLYELPENIRAAVFDQYILSGPNAIKILQDIAGMPEEEQDGKVGPKTIEAIKNSNITANQYADRRELYFKRVVKKSPEKKESLEGWLNRANKYRI